MWLAVPGCVRIWASGTSVSTEIYYVITVAEHRSTELTISVSKIRNTRRANADSQV